MLGCFFILTVLQVHGSHYQVQPRVKANYTNVLVHQKLSFFGHIIAEAELSIVKPFDWIILLIWVILQIILEQYVDVLKSPQIHNVPLRVLMISEQIILIGQSLEFLAFFFFKVLLELSFGLVLVASLALHEVVVHVGVLVDADINCLIKEDLHLLLEEGVELCFELLFLLLGLQSLMINLLVVFLNCQSVDGLLELRSDFSVV